MPLYLYRCEACGAEEEHLQKFSDPPVTTCDSCGGTLARVITPAAFHLKGGGWYKDLYASAKPDSGGGADAGGGSGGDKSSSAGDSAIGSETKSKKSDSKADSKADGKSKPSGTKKAGKKKAASK